MDTTLSDGIPSAWAWSARHAATTVVPPEPHSRYESALVLDRTWWDHRAASSAERKTRAPSAGATLRRHVNPAARSRWPPLRLR